MRKTAYALILLLSWGRLAWADTTLKTIRDAVKCMDDLDRQFLQFSSENELFGGYSIEYLTTRRKRPALWVPVASSEGLGKSSWIIEVARCFEMSGEERLITHTAKVDDTSIFPPEYLLQLASVSLNRFGFRALGVAEEIHRARALPAMPNWKIKRQEIFDEAKDRFWKKKKGEWEIEARERMAQTAIYMSRSAPPPPPPKGNYAPSPGSASSEVTTDFHPYLPSLNIPDPPDYLEWIASDEAEAYADKTLQPLMEEWERHYEGTQLWRDATSGEGRMSLDPRKIDLLRTDLITAVSNYGKLCLKLRDQYELIINFKNSELLRLEADLTLLPAPQVVEARDKVLQEISSLDAQIKLFNDEGIDLSELRDEDKLHLADLKRQKRDKNAELHAFGPQALFEAYQQKAAAIFSARTSRDSAQNSISSGIVNARTNLMGELDSHGISARIVALVPSWRDLIGEPDPKDPHQALLHDADFVSYKISHDTTAVTNNLVNAMRNRVFHADGDGIAIAGLYNIPKLTALIRKERPATSDAAHAIEEIKNDSPEGRAIRRELAQQMFGGTGREIDLEEVEAAVQIQIDSPDQASAESRNGGLPEPKRSFRRNDWRRLINNLLVKMGEDFTRIVRENGEGEIGEFVFDPSIEELVYRLGGNPRSDLRPLAPVRMVLKTKIWRALVNRLQDCRGSNIFVTYNSDDKRIEFYASPLGIGAEGITPENTVLINSIGYSPKFAANEGKRTLPMNEQLKELIAYRETMRILVGIYAHGSFCKDGKVDVDSLNSTTEFWDSPHPDLATPDYELTEILMMEALVQAESRFRRGALLEETRSFQKAAKERFRRLSNSQTQRTALEKTFSFFKLTTHAWFVDDQILENVNQPTRDDQEAIPYKSVEVVVQNILGVFNVDGRDSIVNQVAKLIYDAIEKDERIPVEEIKRLFLARVNMSNKLRERLMILKEGTVRSAPNTCDFIVISQLENSGSEVKESSPEGMIFQFQWPLGGEGSRLRWPIRRFKPNGG